MEKRNMATSIVADYNIKQAQWTNWTVRKAVREGYKVSGWVFKAISIISKNISTVPWGVVDEEGVYQPEHPVSLLLNNPNPAFSPQDFFELLSAWQQLSGEAYAKQVKVDNITKELWPVSPDRIAPIESEDPTKLIGGYEIQDKNGKKTTSPEFTPENVISFRFLDPANPIKGIGPLQVAAKAVDIDIQQLEWNMQAMSNRGILDGVFTFAERLDADVYTTIKAKIKELFQGKNNARDIGVIGSNAKYQRLSLTPAEMDFITSRKFNREEIFIIFGVPPQLAGVMESSTFNNFNTARVIFWETTLIPILNDLANTLNRALKEELGDGFKIAYDLTNIPALKKDGKEKAETAKIYSEMGVPMEKLNEMFKLGVPEYEGWDKPVTKAAQPAATTTDENRGAKKGLMLKKLEKRDVDEQIVAKEKTAQKGQASFLKALKVQEEAVFKALDESSDPVGAINSTSDEMEKALTDYYKKTAARFSATVLIDNRGKPVDFETRAIDPFIEAEIDDFLTAEGVILSELSLLNKTTIASIFDTVIDGEQEGKTTEEIKQAISDSGTFSPARALSIARTTGGTAQSIGQMAGALSVGATKKIWRDSGFEVREEHIARDGETVDINGRFSRQFNEGSTPRWPLDQDIAASDRINCRCSMTFEM